MGEVGNAQDLHPSRSKFDRERNAVQPPANVGNDRRGIVGQRKGPIDEDGSINEERYCTEFHDRCSG
ncbi:MAG: hypothetical protein WB526_08750, partial [Candidatus Cybelea sp.]